MKRFLCLILAIVLCFALAACGKDEEPSTSNSGTNVDTGEVVESDDFFEWSSTNDTQIVGFTELGLKQKKIAIPSKCTSVQGLLDNTTVTYIEFKGENTVILSNAFNGCTSLETVVLPKGLKEIESGTFDGCTSLKSIAIPDGVTEIGSNAFLSCTALETVEMNEQLTVVGRKAFSGCSNLKSVTIPDTVETVEKSAFEGCISLANVTFGNGIKTIEDSAFRSCDSLKKVELQEGLKTLEKDAFSFCEKLESIFIPSSVDSAALACIAQTHEITVYVVKGSYMDSRVDELMDTKYYNKQYR